MNVLVVEDNEDIAELLAKGFRYKNIACMLASNGKEALQAFACHSFEMVIVDLMLPDMNGADVVHAIRAEDSTTSILVLSALQDFELKAKLYMLKYLFLY